MVQRTLIIHAGGGKAGSSALQSALSCASDDLAELGLAYVDYHPRSSAYEVSTGNGFRLYEEIVRPGFETSGKEAIRFFLGDKSVGICSSEFLGALRPRHWEAIIRAANDINVELKIVYFVRSAAGYIASSYNQNVKRGGEARALPDVVDEYPWQHYDELQNLSATFDAEHLRVINYDHVRNEIGQAFANAYPELAPAAELLGELGRLLVNRSLTGAELEVICRINDRFSSLYSHDISDRLLYEAPDIKASTTVPAVVTEIIVGKFEEPTRWINERFFPDGDGLRVELDEGRQGEATADPIERPLRIALDWALGAIENRSTEIEFIRERLLAIDWENSDDPMIPAHFDPLAYLLLNPDVLRSQLPPYLHFIQSGHGEIREYRWPLSVAAFDKLAAANAIKEFPNDGGDPLAPADPLSRVEQSIQLEGLMHQYPEREHEYLALISGRKTRGHENRFALLHPLHDLLEGFRRETERSVAQMQALTKVAQDLTSQVSALSVEQARLSAMVERSDKDLPEQRDGVLEIIARNDEQLPQDKEQVDCSREVPISPAPEMKILPGRANKATARRRSSQAH